MFKLIVLSSCLMVGSLAYDVAKHQEHSHRLVYQNAHAPAQYDVPIPYVTSQEHSEIKTKQISVHQPVYQQLEYSAVNHPENAHVQYVHGVEEPPEYAHVQEQHYAPVQEQVQYQPIAQHYVAASPHHEHVHPHHEVVHPQHEVVHPHHEVVQVAHPHHEVVQVAHPHHEVVQVSHPHHEIAHEQIQVAHPHHHEHHQIAHEGHSNPHDAHAEIKSSETLVKSNGEYAYGFDTTNGIAKEESGLAGHSVKGSSQHITPEGELVTLKYIADENGFHAEGSHIPTPPPLPQHVIETLAWNAAHPEEEEEDHLYEHEDHHHEHHDQHYQQVHHQDHQHYHNNDY
ncbi:hypothetical protein ACFFRR_011524 [Megaselia abdita]